MKKRANSPAVTQRPTLEERLEAYPWELSELFGDMMDINDFESHHYVHFLNKVKSVEDLREGLYQLSPLANDALEIAERMTKKGFASFKRTLLSARIESGENQLPLFGEARKRDISKYAALLVPRGFILASEIADKFHVSLGVALIRIMETEHSR